MSSRDPVRAFSKYQLPLVLGICNEEQFNYAQKTLDSDQSHDTHFQAENPPTTKPPLINKQDTSGETALHKCARQGLLARLVDLVSQGADTFITDHAGWAPLHLAGQAEKARVLLLAGADPNLANPNNGNTPLHEAARFNNVDVIQLLLDFGANPDLQNHSRQKPMDLATQDDAMEVLSRFFERRRPSHALTEMSARDMIDIEQDIFAIFAPLCKPSSDNPSETAAANALKIRVHNASNSVHAALPIKGIVFSEPSAEAFIAPKRRKVSSPIRFRNGSDKHSPPVNSPKPEQQETTKKAASAAAAAAAVLPFSSDLSELPSSGESAKGVRRRGRPAKDEALPGGKVAPTAPSAVEVPKVPKVAMSDIPQFNKYGEPLSSQALRSRKKRALLKAEKLSLKALSDSAKTSTGAPLVREPESATTDLRPTSDDQSSRSATKRSSASSSSQGSSQKAMTRSGRKGNAQELAMTVKKEEAEDQDGYVSADDEDDEEEEEEREEGETTEKPVFSTNDSDGDGDVGGVLHEEHDYSDSADAAHETCPGKSVVEDDCQTETDYESAAQAADHDEESYAFDPLSPPPRADIVVSARHSQSSMIDSSQGHESYHVGDSAAHFAAYTDATAEAARIDEDIADDRREMEDDEDELGNHPHLVELLIPNEARSFGALPQLVSVPDMSLTSRHSPDRGDLHRNNGLIPLPMSATSPFSPRSSHSAMPALLPTNPMSHSFISFGSDKGAKGLFQIPSHAFITDHVTFGESSHEGDAPTHEQRDDWHTRPRRSSAFSEPSNVEQRHSDYSNAFDAPHDGHGDEDDGEDEDGLQAHHQGDDQDEVGLQEYHHGVHEHRQEHDFEHEHETQERSRNLSGSSTRSHGRSHERSRSHDYDRERSRDVDEERSRRSYEHEREHERDQDYGRDRSRQRDSHSDRHSQPSRRTGRSSSKSETRSDRQRSRSRDTESEYSSSTRRRTSRLDPPSDGEDEDDVVRSKSSSKHTRASDERYRRDRRRSPSDDEHKRERDHSRSYSHQRRSSDRRRRSNDRSHRSDQYDSHTSGQHRADSPTSDTQRHQPSRHRQDPSDNHSHASWHDRNGHGGERGKQTDNADADSWDNPPRMLPIANGAFAIDIMADSQGYSHTPLRFVNVPPPPPPRVIPPPPPRQPHPAPFYAKDCDEEFVSQVVSRKTALRLRDSSER